MKTLLLTGGTGEIGQAIASKFAQQDYQVISPSRSEMDLESNQSVDQFLNKLTQPIDVFIYCAGFNAPKPVTEISKDDLNKTLQINALSFFTMTHHLLNNQLINNNGHILGVSSIYGFLVRKGRFSYSASKHCLNGMVKTLALELGQKNIKANLIAPGFVDTKMTRKNNSEKVIEGFKQKIPLGRLAQTDDIADVAFFLCSEQNRFITGQEIVVDGGYSIGGFES